MIVIHTIDYDIIHSIFSPGTAPKMGGGTFFSKTQKFSFYLEFFIYLQVLTQCLFPESVHQSGQGRAPPPPPQGVDGPTPPSPALPTEPRGQHFTEQCSQKYYKSMCSIRTPEGHLGALTRAATPSVHHGAKAPGPVSPSSTATGHGAAGSHVGRGVCFFFCRL